MKWNCNIFLFYDYVDKWVNWSITSWKWNLVFYSYPIHFLWIPIELSKTYLWSPLCSGLFVIRSPLYCYSLFQFHVFEKVYVKSITCAEICGFMCAIVCNLVLCCVFSLFKVYGEKLFTLSIPSALSYTCYFIKLLVIFITI